MQEAEKSRLVFRFAVFEMDAGTGELRKQGMRIRLQEQPSQILLMLLEHAGELVSLRKFVASFGHPTPSSILIKALGQLSESCGRRLVMMRRRHVI